MSEKQLPKFSTEDKSSNSRYAFQSSPRNRRNSTIASQKESIHLNDLHSHLNRGVLTRVKRQTQNLQPYEYTIYLTPDQVTEKSSLNTPKYDEIRSIYPIGARNRTQNIFCKPDILYPSNIQNTNLNPFVAKVNQRTCPPYVQQLPTIVNCKPITNPVVAQNLVKNPNLPVYPPALPVYTANVRPTLCNNPLITASLPTKNQQLASLIPKNILQSPLKLAYPLNNVPSNCISTTIKPSTTVSIPTTTPPSTFIATTTASAIVDNCAPEATDGPFLTATISPIYTIPSRNESGNGDIFIEKAVIIVNQDNQQNASIAIKAIKALENLPSNKESKIIELLEKIHKDLEKANKRQTISLHDCDEDFQDDDYLSTEDSDAQVDEDCNYDDYSDVDEELETNKDKSKKPFGRANQFGKRMTEPNKPFNKKCETGQDLIEACKHLTQTISVYQRP